MTEDANLNFAKPEFTYDELEAKLSAYTPKPGYAHEQEATICLEESIRAGRMGNVAVGGCLKHHDQVIHRDISKAVAPYHRTDLHVEMVLLNQLEDRLCDNPTPRMRDYTLFTSQEPCPMCLARICFNQVGRTYYVYRDASSPEAGTQTNWERLPPGFRGLADRLEIAEADCSPELKELSRQIWVTSIGPAIDAFRSRY